MAIAINVSAKALPAYQIYEVTFNKLLSIDENLLTTR